MNRLEYMIMASHVLRSKSKGARSRISIRGRRKVCDPTGEVLADSFSVPPRAVRKAG